MPSDIRARQLIGHLRHKSRRKVPASSSGVDALEQRVSRVGSGRGALARLAESLSPSRRFLHR
jgi:hypothetical protein